MHGRSRAEIRLRSGELRIIESHGGEIAVTEFGSGGSTFSIRLPKKRQQGAE
jgi:signal transduction histidine kinase